MKLLTKNTAYAIRAVIYLAKSKERFISSRQIAKYERIPLQFLRRILQILIKEGIVTSKEGIKGGVRLRPSPGNINLICLIKMFQGNIEFLDCMLRKEMCANLRRCALRKRIKQIEKKVITELKRITIANLLKDTKGV